MNSPDLAPSDYRLLGLTKVEEVKTAMMKWLKEQSSDFYKTGVYALIRRWKIAIESNGDYVEK